MKTELHIFETMYAILELACGSVSLKQSILY